MAGAGTTKQHGGRRSGAGRKRSVEGGRCWLRDVIDHPERRLRFVHALDACLLGWARAKSPSEAAGAAVTAYLRAFEHGYGRPPQALDVKLDEFSDVDRVLEHLLKER